MRIGFWDVFERVDSRHIAPRVTLEADGLLLPAGCPVSFNEPERGLILRPMLDHDLELESGGDVLSLRGYYRELPFEFPSFEGKPPHGDPPSGS